MYESLLKWIEMLNLSTHSENDLSNGVELAELMNQISPQMFPNSWLQKIKFVDGDNWRLKVSNLKKIVEGVFDYYNEAMSISLTENLRPELILIAEKNDIVETGKLVQLILGG